MTKKTEEKKEIKMTQQQVIQNYEIHKQRLQQVNQRINSLISIIKELETSQNALKELEKNKENNVQVMIGAGIYVEATIKQLEKVTVQLPNNVLVKKTIKETLKEINTRIEETNKLIEETRKTLEHETKQMQFFQNILIQSQQFLQKQREQKK